MTKKKIALKKSINQLQKILDYLGKFGGTISTKRPDTWWTLELAVESINEDKENVRIGVYKYVNGDCMYDPQVRLTLTMRDGMIVNAEIHEFINTTIFGTSIVDADGLIHVNGITEKYPYGLRSLFADFMDTMESGPYLTDPAKVTRYDDIMRIFY